MDKSATGQAAKPSIQVFTVNSNNKARSSGSQLAQTTPVTSGATMEALISLTAENQVQTLTDPSLPYVALVFLICQSLLLAAAWKWIHGSVRKTTPSTIRRTSQCRHNSLGSAPATATARNIFPAPSGKPSSKILFHPSELILSLCPYENVIFESRKES